MIRYGDWINILVPSRAAGNALAGQVSSEPGDAHAFDYAVECFAPGTTFTDVQDGPITRKVPSAPAVAFAMGVCCTAGVRASVEALIATGLPDGVMVEVGDRATVEPHFAQFVADSGYVMQ